MSQAIKVFLLNHPRDHEFLDELCTYLKPLVDNNRIDLWNPTKILPGVQINHAIKEKLKEAEIFIPLVSSNYLADGNLMATQNDATELNIRILPVIIQTCLWQLYEIFNKYELYPKQSDNQLLPINEWQNKGAAYMSVANAIYTILQPLLEERKKNDGMKAMLQPIWEKQQKNPFNLPIIKLPSQNFDNGHALLIGVGKDLPITVKDANGLSNVLKNQAAYPESQVHLLTEKRATKERILEGFDALKTDENSTVVVYYSGHGGVFKKADGTHQYYLLPNDFDSTQFEKTALTAEVFSAKINAIRAKKMVVLLDACHAAGMPKTKAFDFTKSTEVLVNELDKGGGRIVVASCRDNQLSYIYPDEAYSTFTHSLINALSGAAYHENDGYMRILNVLVYLMDKVPKRTNGKQCPYIKRIENLDDNFAVCALKTVTGKEENTDDVGSEKIPTTPNVNTNNKPKITMSNDQFNRRLKRLEKRLEEKEDLVDEIQTTIDELQKSITILNPETRILDIKNLKNQKKLKERQLDEYEVEIEDIEQKIAELKSKHQKSISKSSQEPVQEATPKNASNQEPPPDLATIEGIRTIIYQGRTEVAIDATSNYAKAKGSDLYNQTILLSARFQSLRRGKMGGGISNGNFNVGKTKIINSLLEILKDLEKGW